jgi:hypothetical protein
MKTDIAMQVAHRLIDRDLAIRSAEKRPLWNSVQRIIDYAVGQQLLPDSIVDEWLRTIAGVADAWISRRLLGTVGALLDTGAQVQAHSLYRRIFGLDDPARWQILEQDFAKDSMLTAAGIQHILGRFGLLASYPATWGRTACALLGRLVIAQQKRDWGLELQVSAEVYQRWGEGFDAQQPFAINLTTDHRRGTSAATDCTPRERFSQQQSNKECRRRRIYQILQPFGFLRTNLLLSDLQSASEFFLRHCSIACAGR